MEPARTSERTGSGVGDLRCRGRCSTAGAVPRTPRQRGNDDERGQSSTGTGADHGLHDLARCAELRSADRGHGAELGESWGDLSFDDALAFFDQPEAATLEFVAIAVDGEDETTAAPDHRIIRGQARDKGIKVILIADQVSPAACTSCCAWGPRISCPIPLPEGALHEAIERMRRPAARPAAARPSAADRATDVHPDLQAAKGDRDGVILPVHGLAGGVGATSFAVNLAWELATSPRPMRRASA
jgi:hypothetical protein